MRAPLYMSMVACFLARPAYTAAAETASEIARPEATRVESLVDDEAERLRALGYVEFSPEPAARTQVGVVELDLARAQPGHTLVVFLATCSAQLIDLAGTQLHSWRQSECKSWVSAALLRNGDLVVNGKREIDRKNRAPSPGPSDESVRARRQASRGRFTARISWAGELVWLRYLRSHHQLDWTPENEVLVLTESRTSAKELRAALPHFESENSVDADGYRFHDNALNWLGADGEVKKSVSLLHAATHPRSSFDFVTLETMREGPTAVGLFHANGAYAINQPHLVGSDPIFAKGNVLVTSRNQNRIFIVDPSGPWVVWEWGKDELSGPHNGTWISNGHILVFDNGIELDNTRILEIDPHRKVIVWRYPNGNRAKFYSPTRGMAQRFENGNTLIVNSRAGEVFEVTASGERVWHYFIPFAPDKERRPIATFMKRYPESWLLKTIE